MFGVKLLKSSQKAHSKGAVPHKVFNYDAKFAPNIIHKNFYTAAEVGEIKCHERAGTKMHKCLVRISIMYIITKCIW